MKKDLQNLPLRSGVGIVVLNKENKVFVAKRIDNPKNFWQMPQGGVDEGENFLKAAYRELEEETSIKNVELIKELVESIGGQMNMDKFRKAVSLQNETFDYNGFEMLKASVDYIPEAEYRGKKVQLNKPKRGGSKKFYVYVKSKKGNVKKVSFGDTGLSVKFKKKGARASFAARHKCAQKKDKTKAGYWSCNIGRYWKSLGGSSNFSGYW